MVLIVGILHYSSTFHRNSCLLVSVSTVLVLVLSQKMLKSGFIFLIHIWPSFWRQIETEKGSLSQSSHVSHCTQSQWLAVFCCVWSVEINEVNVFQKLYNLVVHSLGYLIFLKFSVKLAMRSPVHFHCGFHSGPPGLSHIWGGVVKAWAIREWAAQFGHRRSV